MTICLSKQSTFASKSPVSSIFNSWSRDHIKLQGTSFSLRKKFSFVLGFLAKDIPNHSFVQNTIEPGLAWEGNRAAGMSRDPRKKGSFHVSSSQLMQTLKTARTNNNKLQIILSLTFYVWTIKENWKRSKHRKLPRNPS